MSSNGLGGRAVAHATARVSDVSERIERLDWQQISNELDQQGYGILGGLVRSEEYSHLQPIANHWNEVMEINVQYPKEHSQYINRCLKAGQLKPTPLLLQYGPGDFNCLHQDLYGEHVFPIQVTVLLSQPGRDFTGGEFLLVEQRPRMQSRAEVVPLRRGDAVAFAVHHRPVHGKRGPYRVNLRHGVSRVRSGCRSTLGIIFHDAK
jgi:uncharacterized protein